MPAVSNSRERGSPMLNHSSRALLDSRSRSHDDCSAYTERFDDFVGLIERLADYERLERPDAAAIARLRADAFAPRPRFEAALALDEADRPITYAIWFETYSSFLAKPTIFQEDLFVLEHARRSGAGGTLFEFVRKLGEGRGCGRMDWNVLDWNAPARDFYHRRKALWMKEWLLYRLTY